MFKNCIATRYPQINKRGEKIYLMKFRWSRWIKTKNPLKTLNHVGDLFYFTPEYLKDKGLIDNLGMIELYYYRRKYGRLKKACILELK
jgi:hypothetical protein